MVADPGDSTRLQFETWLAGLPDRLEADPGLRARGEQFKRDVLGSTALRDWSSALWQRAKGGAAGPGGRPRLRAAPPGDPELLMGGGPPPGIGPAAGRTGWSA